MSVKRKDFQKIASTIHHFLLKLTDTYECAELRDSLNLSLLQLQKYYRKFQQRLQHTGRCNLDNSESGYVSPRQSLRITLSRSRDETLSPMTPYIEEPQYFHSHWTVIEEKVDVLRRSVSGDLTSPRRSINTPAVHYAAMIGDIDMLIELQIGKADVFEDQDCIGRTPMMYAAFYNRITVVRWLLERGVSANSCDYNEATPLHWACSQGYAEIIELMLEAGADKDFQDSFGRSATHWACTCASLDPLKFMIEFGANVNLHDRNGLTPAMWACRLDHLEHLKLLSSVKDQCIDHIDGFERDRNGRTIVHWSIRRQQPFECLRYLLTEETAQLKDDEGKTILLLAAEQGCLESCKIIIEKFGTRFLCDLDDKDRTCLHLATVGGHGEVVNYMLEKGMNVNSKDKTGATCMEIARNQYLFYCQLIISSHIREKEKKLDSGANDNVDVIENIISRHNSISDSRNQAVTPPRPPKSAKTNTPKSPTLKRRIQQFNSNGEHSNENSNGFDVMSSDPVNNGFEGRVSPDSSQIHYGGSDLRDERAEVADFVQLSPVHSPQTARYIEAVHVDYLDNQTGEQYHGTHKPGRTARGVDQHQSRNNSLESRTDDQEVKSPKRTMKRAQQANRIHSDRSDRDNDRASVTTNGPTENVPPIEIDSPVQRQIPSHTPTESFSRINYGATLEPIKSETSLAPRRKKKRNNRPRKIVTQSQDRFSQPQDRETATPPYQTISMENMSTKYSDPVNGVILRKHFPSTISSLNTEFPVRNSQTVNRNDAALYSNISNKPGIPWGNEHSDRILKRPPKLAPPMEIANHRYSNHSSFPNL